LGLDKAIKEVVAKFDVDTLQMNRDISRMVKDSFSAPKKKERPN
jgi:myo-inositol-1-phosphate synthase